MSTGIFVSPGYMAHPVTYFNKGNSQKAPFLSGLLTSPRYFVCEFVTTVGHSNLAWLHFRRHHHLGHQVLCHHHRRRRHHILHQHYLQHRLGRHRHATARKQRARPWAVGANVSASIIDEDDGSITSLVQFAVKAAPTFSLIPRKIWLTTQAREIARSHKRKRHQGLRPAAAA